MGFIIVIAVEYCGIILGADQPGQTGVRPEAFSLTSASINIVVLMNALLTVTLSHSARIGWMRKVTADGNVVSASVVQSRRETRSA